MLVRLGAALIALMALGAAGAAATAPEGPRLALVVFHPYPNLGSELVTVDAQGGNRLRLAGGSDEEIEEEAEATGKEGVYVRGDRATWSPDGDQLVFAGSTGGGQGGIFLAHSDGSDPRLLARLPSEGDPIFSPDGRLIAFPALKVLKGHFERAGRWSRAMTDDRLVVAFAILGFDIGDRSVHRLTPWRRNLMLIPSSYSPDGRRLAATAIGLGFSMPKVAVVSLGGGDEVEFMARNAREPVYSPDGSSIAFVRDREAPSGRKGHFRFLGSKLLVMSYAGRGVRRLARSSGHIASPSWDPSGQRIAYSDSLGSSAFSKLLLGAGRKVMEVNADGSCPTKMLAVNPRSILSGPSWQPGFGREAGRLAC